MQQHCTDQPRIARVDVSLTRAELVLRGNFPAKGKSIGLGKGAETNSDEPKTVIIGGICRLLRLRSGGMLMVLIVEISKGGARVDVSVSGRTAASVGLFSPAVVGSTVVSEDVLSVS